MNKGILIVYNTCTINKESVDLNQVNGWLDDIQSILSQKFEHYKLVISECRGSDKNSFNTDDSLNSFIKDVIENNCFYNIIYEKIPVHVTFNYALMEMVKEFGNFEYYMYILIYLLMVLMFLHQQEHYV